jgi:hypothetical protein
MIHPRLVTVGKSKTLLVIYAVAALYMGGVVAGTAIAQKAGPAKTTPDKVALAADEVKQLLLMMDTDKNGKISKAEFMNYMSAEFDRLDADKSGELDVKELAQSQFKASRPPAPVGK